MLDIGSYQMKAGYAGEDTPKHVFSSVRAANGDEDGEKKRGARKETGEEGEVA